MTQRRIACAVSGGRFQLDGPTEKGKSLNVRIGSWPLLTRLRCFAALECWSPIHQVLTSGVPQPPEIDKETPAVLQSYIERINHGFDALKQQIETFKPDVLLIVGDDQAEVFTEANMPPFSVFTCAEVHGSHNIGLIGEPEEENHITLRCHAELATYLFD